MRRLRLFALIAFGLAAALALNGCYTQVAPPVEHETADIEAEKPAPQEEIIIEDDEEGDTHIYIYGGYPLYSYGFDPYYGAAYWDPFWYPYGHRPYGFGFSVSFGFGAGYWDPFWNPFFGSGYGYYGYSPYRYSGYFGYPYYGGFYGGYGFVPVVYKELKKRPFARRGSQRRRVGDYTTGVAGKSIRSGSATTTRGAAKRSSDVSRRRIRKSDSGTQTRSVKPTSRSSDKSKRRVIKRNSNSNRRKSISRSSNRRSSRSKSVRRTRKSSSSRSKSYKPSRSSRSKSSSGSRSSGSSKRRKKK